MSSTFQKENQKILTNLGIEIREQLRFINETIREDREKLENYKAIHGDLYFREKIEGGYGAPDTERVIKPLVNEYRQTINNLLNSLSIIENKLPDDPEETVKSPFTPKPEISQSELESIDIENAEQWLDSAFEEDDT